MRLLILSFYYHPDLSAGSFRATALVKELMALVPPGSEIDVVTTLPNRYDSFSTKAQELEVKPGLSIRRFLLPSHRSGMVDQSKSFASFARQVLRYVDHRDYDLVFATSSRLMTAVLGGWIAKKKRSLLYLDIRDIFVDTINDVLPKYIALIAKPFFNRLEQWSIKRANRINLVSKGFADYFEPRYPQKAFTYFTNGIDDEFIEVSPKEITKHSTNTPLTVVYAGNIGEGQGLHSILPQLAKQMEQRLNFKVIGDGGRKEALILALKEWGVSNVELLSPMKREALIQAYLSADVLFLHLNDYEAFKKVLPSKLFEYAAMGKPIWAGLAGYSAGFVQSEICNSAVFKPCDADEARRVFDRLILETTPRVDFITKHARQNIAKAMAEDVVMLANRGN